MPLSVHPDTSFFTKSSLRFLAKGSSYDHEATNVFGTSSTLVDHSGREFTGFCRPLLAELLYPLSAALFSSFDRVKKVRKIKPFANRLSRLIWNEWTMLFPIGHQC